MSARVITLPVKRRQPRSGLIHVWRFENGDLEVIHESRSGESFGSLRHFPADARDEAVRFALAALPDFAPCRLGEVVSCL